MSVSPVISPFIADDQRIPEFTLIPILMGVLLGIVFGASSLYLALKVGMTVSASIPVAVMSITLFRTFSRALGLRNTTILENNLVQTTGSAGESIAFGVAVTMPALLILGYEMEVSQVMLVAVLGGMMGVLMMIPLRWTLMVKEHGTLTYPEGTACARVLEAGEKGGATAQTVFMGFGIGLFYKFANVGLKLWKDVPTRSFAWYKGALFATEVSPELLGVGYIIGPRVAATMVAGGILSTFVLIPAIFLFGGTLKEPLFPATQLISTMSTHDVWRSYVLYIGAGAVASGGIISLLQSLPMIAKSVRDGLRGVKIPGRGVSKGPHITQVKRTEQDLPLPFVFLGLTLLVVAMSLAPSLKLNLVGGGLVILFGFLFVTVSSRLTGSVGSSSNPISGMTVATLLLTCLVFVLMGRVGPEHRVTALCIAAIVCVAASNGGTTSQDLKTGYLLGATPRLQQMGLLIGALTSAIVIGFTLLLLNRASTIYHKLSTAEKGEGALLLKDAPPLRQETAPDGQSYGVVYLSEPRGVLGAGKYLVDSERNPVFLVDPGINGVLKARDDGTPVQKYEAPKARLMSMIIDGIMTQKLPWSLVLIGVFLSIVFELVGVPSLPFAVGVYLPLSSSTPIFFGGLIRWWVDRRKQSPSESTGPGVLFSSGLIAGGAIAGIGLALFSLKEHWGAWIDLSGRFPWLSESDFAPYLFFGVLISCLLRAGLKGTAGEAV